MSPSFYFHFIFLCFGHLVADFFIQPDNWVEGKSKKKWKSKWLYLHGSIAGVLPLLFAGLGQWALTYLKPALPWTYNSPFLWFGLGLLSICLHTVIDLVKTYLPDNTILFVTDQLGHLLTLVAICLFLNQDQNELFLVQLGQHISLGRLYTLLIMLVLTKPTSYLIQQILKQFTNGPSDKTASYSLSKGGEAIGIAERLIILISISTSNPEAIGWMVASKSILRFNEIKSGNQAEYVLVGTLCSTLVATLLSIIAVALNR